MEPFPMGSSGYYSEGLSGTRLRQCYDLASAPVRAYLQAEIDHLVSRSTDTDSFLELGCGYGRVLRHLAPRVAQAVGIDTSRISLMLAREYLAGTPTLLALMDACELGFPDGSFDLVSCIQNGISAFHCDPVALVREALRVTKQGGRTIFSSYSERFWDHRLAWFEQQAEAGLVGPIDYQRTGGGIIVCHDGFRATTFDSVSFDRIAKALRVEGRIYEVAESCLFCEFVPG